MSNLGLILATEAYLWLPSSYTLPGPAGYTFCAFEYVTTAISNKHYTWFTLP